MVSHCSFDSVSLMASDIEHLFLYLLPDCMSSWKRCLLRSSAHFLIVLFVWCRVLRVLYIFWILNLHQSCCLQISSPIQFVAFLFRCQFVLLRATLSKESSSLLSLSLFYPIFFHLLYSILNYLNIFICLFVYFLSLQIETQAPQG